MTAGSYTITLGNINKKTLPSIMTYFKDVRLWTTVRTYQQITEQRSNQLDRPYPASLLSYFKFNSGTPLQFDEVGKSQATLFQTDRRDPRSFDSASEFQVCPVQTYTSYYTSKCL